MKNAQARDRRAYTLQGKFAYLNFPEEIYNCEREELRGTNSPCVE